MIELGKLPKEIRDQIELKEATDMTFNRFVDEDYSDWFWSILSERSNPNVEHSIIFSIYGMQGSGKCYYEGTKVSTKRGVIEGKDLVVGDIVFNERGDDVVVKNKWFSERNCVEVGLDFANDMVLSMEHRVQTVRGLVPAGDLLIGDFVRVSSRNPAIRGSRREYERAFVFGAYLADGSGVLSERFVKAKRKDGLRKDGCSRFLQISNNDRGFLEYVAGLMKEHFSFYNVVVRRASGTGRFVLVASGKDEVIEFIDTCGRISAEKRVSAEIMLSLEGVRGFLDGYCNGDMTCNVVKGKGRGGKYKTEVGWLLKSECAAMGVLDALHVEGFWPSVRVRELKSGKWSGNKYYRLTLPAKVVEVFFQSRCWVNVAKAKRVAYVVSMRRRRVVGSSYNTVHGNNVVTSDKSVIDISGEKYVRVIKISEVGNVRCVDIEVDGESHLFQFAGGVVTHNSLAAISMACYMDSNMTVDNIYFGYDQLVYNRHKLKPNSVVIVDEQSEQYGLDSHRISVILQNLKEQLRKKSIHFFFCAPVLYPESKSSMYLLETIFVDFETQECYAALKTRDGLTLGHIRIPHPLKLLGDGRSLATKELLAAYQAKKDEHLEKVLGQKNMDIFEERAVQVMQHALFLKAEKIYKKKMGYIPQSTVVQIINKIYPEYQAGVVPLEIAGRIRLDKELSGVWDISGRAGRRRNG